MAMRTQPTTTTVRLELIDQSLHFVEHFVDFMCDRMRLLHRTRSVRHRMQSIGQHIDFITGVVEFGVLTRMPESKVNVATDQSRVRMDIASKPIHDGPIDILG